MMKISYLCSVDNKDGNSAQGSENFVSGLRDFTACPARKKHLTLNIKHLTLNI
jgi:hypothetical protein